jgi:hypothetical protein
MRIRNTIVLTANSVSGVPIRDAAFVSDKENAIETAPGTD